MRIHIQNAADEAVRPITHDEWLAAGGGRTAHTVTFGVTPEAFRAGMAEAEALVIATNALRPLLPLGAPNLRMVFCTSAGLDRLAPYEWLPAGVPLLNNSGTHAVKAGEYVIMALLMLVNEMPSFIADQRERRWSKRLGGILAGKRVAILGLGALGGASAHHATAFGMDVTGVRTVAEPHPDCRRVVTLDDLDSILPEMDMVVLTLPLTDKTRHVLDRHRIGLLRRGAAVVNIGRGGLVEQDALCDALDSGALGGAILDVFVPEPVPPDHRLWTTRNLVMTPHMSSDDPAHYNQRSLEIFLENVACLEQGKPLPNAFDIVRGY